MRSQSRKSWNTNANPPTIHTGKDATVNRLDFLIVLVLILSAYGWLWTIYTVCTC